MKRVLVVLLTLSWELREFATASPTAGESEDTDFEETTGTVDRDPWKSEHFIKKVPDNFVYDFEEGTDCVQSPCDEQIEFMDIDVGVGFEEAGGPNEEELAISADTMQENREQFDLHKNVLHKKWLKKETKKLPRLSKEQIGLKVQRVLADALAVHLSAPKMTESRFRALQQLFEQIRIEVLGADKMEKKMLTELSVRRVWDKGWVSKLAEGIEEDCNRHPITDVRKLRFKSIADLKLDIVSQQWYDSRQRAVPKKKTVPGNVFGVTDTRKPGNGAFKEPLEELPWFTTEPYQFEAREVD